MKSFGFIFSLLSLQQIKHWNLLCGKFNSLLRPVQNHSGNLKELLCSSRVPTASWMWFFRTFWVWSQWHNHHAKVQGDLYLPGLVGKQKLRGPPSRLSKVTPIPWLLHPWSTVWRETSSTLHCTTSFHVAIHLHDPMTTDHIQINHKIIAHQ